MLKLNNSRRAIGRYPIITLSQARTEAKRLLAEKTLGKTRPMSMSVKSAQKLFIEEKKLRRRWRTVRDFEYQFKRHYNLPGQVQDVQFSEMLRRLERIKSPSSYNAALAAGRAFFNWCMKRRYITDSPVMGLSPRHTPSRSRVLTDDELKAVWIASDQCGNFGVIVKLLILTGQRRGEVSALRSEYFSNAQCTLPPSLTKNGREHTFPLGTLTTSIIKTSSAGQTGFIFPARRRLNTPFNGWSKGKAELDKLSGVNDWVLHDLRRTFATGLAALGTAPHVIEKLINHITGTLSGVAGIYNRFKYEKECRTAIEAWESKLQAVLQTSDARKAA